MPEPYPEVLDDTRFANTYYSLGDRQESITIFRANSVTVDGRTTFRGDGNHTRLMFQVYDDGVSYACQPWRCRADRDVDEERWISHGDIKLISRDQP